MTDPANVQRRFAEYTATLDCVHCGLCIPHCPTHRVTGREADSPRGRIHLMRGWAEGRFDLSDNAYEHLDQCIVCRTCESVCPSGIRMGEMMEAFRAEQNRTRPSGVAASGVGRWALKEILPHRGRIRALTGALAVYQALGLRRVMGAVLGPLAPGLARRHAMQPTVPPRRDRKVPTDRELPGGFPAIGPRRARVALFLGCLASEWFADVHRATIRVLQHNGCDVIVPHGQTCCGALHRHAGILDDADTLWNRNAEVFRGAAVDAVIVNAAGCGASLKEAPADPADAAGSGPSGNAATPAGGRNAGAPVYRDISEFLHQLGLVPPTTPIRRRAAYDPPCHLLHAQRVDIVEELLSAIPGLEWLPLPGRERCCGAGGVYNLLHAEMADAVLAEKTAALLKTGADLVVTGNPGCALQLEYGLRGHGIPVQHPVQLLDAAYGNSALPSS